jgi:hypothetical protein
MLNMTEQKVLKNSLIKLQMIRLVDALDTLSYLSLSLSHSRSHSLSLSHTHSHLSHSLSLTHRIPAQKQNLVQLSVCKKEVHVVSPEQGGRMSL